MCCKIMSLDLNQPDIYSQLIGYTFYDTIPTPIILSSVYYFFCYRWVENLFFRIILCYVVVFCVTCTFRSMFRTIYLSDRCFRNTRTLRNFVRPSISTMSCPALLLWCHRFQTICWLTSIHWKTRCVPQNKDRKQRVFIVLSLNKSPKRTC